MRAFACVLLAAGALGLVGAGEERPTGTIGGRAFKARAVELRKLGLNKVSVEGKVQDKAQAYILAFKGTDEFMPDQYIEVWFATDVSKPIQGMRLVCKPFKFGTEEYRAQHYRPGHSSSVGRGVTGVFWHHSAPGQRDVSGNVSDEIAAVVQFGNTKNGWIAGAIDLQLPKESTRLRGSFFAKLSDK